MKKYLILSTTLIATAQCCFCATEVVSDDLQQALKATSTNEPGLFSILMALLFVICLIYITGVIYSKLNIMGAKTVKEQLKSHDISGVIVLTTTQLGQGKNLHVIEVNGKQMLIGATQHSINLIKELDDNDNKIISSTDTNTEEKETIKSSEVIEDFDLHKKYL